MPLTLEDINNAPSDPLELNKHLMDRGLIPLPPPPQPALPPATVGALSPVTPHNAVTPMVPPSVMGPPESARSENNSRGLAAMEPPHALSPVAAPSMGGTAPEIAPMTPLATPEHADLGIQSMTPPKAPTKAESIEAGKEEYKANRPQVTAPPNSSEFWQQKIAQDEFDKAHPWGSEISAQPGTLGKIGHVLGNIGQIAGGIVAPGVLANIPGTRLNRAIKESGEAAEEGQAAQRENTQENTQSEIGLRGAQKTEAEQRTAEEKQKTEKEATEQNLEKDAQGNVVGWSDAKGVKHSMDEPGTPQAIKDIAEASKSKQGPQLEKSANGDIVQITTDKDGKASSQVVYHGDPKVETELTTRTVNGQEHHVLINKANGQDIKDLGAFKTEVSPTKELAKMKSDEEMVLGYDKDNKSHLMSRADAEAEGLKHISKAESGALDKATTHHVVLNTLQTQLNNVVDSSKALDQGIVQRGIIAQALSHPTDSTVDSAIRATVMAGATEETQRYVQAVRALREAGLALPKEITGGSRVSEVQASALWQTMPGAASLNSKYALDQAKKFQSDIDRLRQRAPQVRGIDMVSSNTGGASDEPPGPAAPGMAWKRNKKTGEFKQFPSQP